MKRILLAAAACVCAAPLFAASPLVNTDVAKRPRLKSVYSTVHSLDQFLKPGTRGLVLVFVGTECPVARQYVPRLKELHAQYHSQGLQFLAIYSDVGVTVFEMARHAHDEDIPFPVLQDVDHRLADLLEVETTPEVVVLDAQK